MVFGSLMQRGTTIITFVRLPASRMLVWNTSMQPLALAVLGISGPPQHMLLASASTPLVRIVRSPWILQYSCSPCNTAYPAKRTLRRKQKRLMFPIRNLKKQMETLLRTYCFETALAQKLKSRVHTFDEWPYISGSTWPSIMRLYD